MAAAFGVDESLLRTDKWFVTKHGANTQLYQGASITEDLTFPLGGQYTGFDVRISASIESTKSEIGYTSSLFLAEGSDQPIITLAEDVSSWLVGDQISIGSTDYSQDQTEVFTLVQCDTCTSNQVRLDRRATYLHWGRIDSRTGIDQRAPVMIMTRNVKIQGEVGTTCQYAKTRESQNEDSPNFGRNWCNHFDGSGNVHTKPDTGDMHGGHVIITGGFANVHISHTEITRMGQPQLARYPLHWHNCATVGNDVYEDPTSFESNSIHNTFNRFITIHGTEGALVYKNAGYMTKGHGYFIEDGWEKNNNITGNLGMVAQQGIVLPTDQGADLCNDADAGYNGQTDAAYCKALSMFWISHIQNYVDDNVAVGGRVGFWFINHNVQSNFLPSLAPFRNNRASSNNRGLMMEANVEERDPVPNRITAKFGQTGARQIHSPTGLGPLEGCHEIVFDGWNLHHSI